MITLVAAGVYRRRKPSAREVLLSEIKNLDVANLRSLRVIATTYKS
jgi:hypothetical protein